MPSLSLGLGVLDRLNGNRRVRARHVHIDHQPIDLHKVRLRQLSSAVRPDSVRGMYRRLLLLGRLGSATTLPFRELFQRGRPQQRR